MTLTVIIPVYNVAPYLRECLDSVRESVRSLRGSRGLRCEVEIICVDDGSTDGSSAILDEYAARFNPSTLKPSNFETLKPFNLSTFRVIHQQNAGPGPARNAALKIAQGEWITFADADDVLNRNWLEAGLRIAERENVDLVQLGYHHGREVPAGFVDRPADEGCRVLDGAAASAWVWDVLAAKGFVWRCFIRRDVIGGLQFPRIACMEDSLWLLGLAQKVRRVAEGRFVGYFYRATEGSLIRRNRKVSQCVTYLESLGTLWAQQGPKAERDGYADVVRKNIRLSADHAIIEWVMKRDPQEDLPRKRIATAYAALESAGAFGKTAYVDRRRYRLGFIWWKLTGQIWAMKFPGLMFLWLRMAINKLKGCKVERYFRAKSEFR